MVNSLTQKIEAVHSSGKSVKFEQAASGYFPEDSSVLASSSVMLLTTILYGMQVTGSH
jgi:hypothetical protein